MTQENNSNENKRQKPTLRQWISCGFWCLLYTLFIVWVGNFWWLLLLPVIFDVFITKFIPWTFWKKTQNKVVYTICSWVDAIIFALVAVYFINLYLFQNYQIPSSSLEKTLLVGDYLYVSKVAYGPRIPNTPLSLPLMQNTIPGTTKNSYIEKPQWPYRRLKGLHDVQRNDIVVFNFPAGDSVPQNVSNPDYYTLSFYASFNNMPVRSDSVMSYEEYCQRLSMGRCIIANQEGQMGKLIWRPVDRRENYVKRCIGLPGETLEIRNDIVYINGKPLEEPEHLQYSYYVETDGTAFSADVLKRLDIRGDESYKVESIDFLSYMNIGCDTMGNPRGSVYRLSLTKETLKVVEGLPFVKKVVRETAVPDNYATIYPLAYSQVWNIHNYGPLYIPKKGESIELTEDNIIRYERIITAYEGNTLSYKNGKAYVNGQLATSYTFQMDYYWMMGDNRDNSADSRMWGFVPEDHIVGRPVFVFFSVDKEHGGIRWNRIFKSGKR
ncbi:MAG: signal peptidase I [Paludibacteraceae bacterium]|nr:signal peptidase I [Paludibacteraceae bacterium]